MTDTENMDENDLCDDIARMVIHDQRCSISLIQRRYGIGYAKAKRMIDELVLRGLIGEYDESTGYQVLITQQDIAKD